MLVLGGRHIKRVHEKYVSKTTHSSRTRQTRVFNSVLTGGYKEDNLDIFGFNITVKRET